MRRNAMAALLALLLTAGVLAPAAFAAGGEAELTQDSGFTPGGESGTASDSDLPPDGQSGTASDSSLTLGGESGTASNSGFTLGAEVLDSGPPPEGGEGVNTQRELIDAIRAGDGEPIPLTGDVEWSSDEPLFLKAGKPTVIEMGGYGIHVLPGARLFLEGPLRLEGAGVRVPLIRCAGELMLGDGVEVSANGDGAVAVHLDGVSWYSQNWAVLRAEGQGATALRQTADGDPGGQLEVSCMRVEARGENAVGIDAEVPVRLYQSSVEAGGESIISTGEIILDGSAASPPPKGARIIRRNAVPGSWAEWLGVSVTASDRPVWDVIENMAYFDLYDADGGESADSITREAVWDGLPPDLSVPGDYPLICTPEPAPDWYPVALSPFKMTLHVVEPDRLWLSGVTATSFEMENGRLQLDFLNPIPDAEQVEVLASADGGKSWQAAGTETLRDGETTSTALCEGLRPDTLYLFRARVTGGPMEGLSNVMRFPFTANDPDQLGGGDHDDDDFGDQGEDPPPAEIIPPPDPGGDDDSTGDGGDDSTGSGSGDGDSGGGNSDNGSSRVDSPRKDSSLVSLPAEAPIPASAPSAPESPAPEVSQPPAPPKEAGLLLTPAELAGQLEANGFVTLIEGEVRAVLPADLLQSLRLADGEAFAARLALTAPDVFEARFWAGNRALSDLGGAFTVSVPWEAPPGAQAACKGADGTELPADSLEDGRAAFSLTQTGVYTIVTRAPASAAGSEAPAPKPPAPVPDIPADAPAAPEARSVRPAVLGGAALLAGGALALYAKKRRGGKRQ